MQSRKGVSAAVHTGANYTAASATRTGVMVGAGGSQYSSFGIDASVPLGPYTAVGGENSVICGRVSYVFGMQGTSVCIDTACSSSLVALHLAARAVLGAECVDSIAAGVSMSIGMTPYATLAAARMLAMDGRCKTLDASADGYGKGECSAVINVGDGDRVGVAGHDMGRSTALLIGSGVNQDGRSSSLTAPNGPSQQALIVRTMQVARTEAGGVGQLEMHGTGTSLGDPIETGAATAVFQGDGCPASVDILTLGAAMEVKTGTLRAGSRYHRHSLGNITCWRGSGVGAEASSHDKPTRRSSCGSSKVAGTWRTSHGLQCLASSADDQQGSGRVPPECARPELRSEWVCLPGHKRACPGWICSGCTATGGQRWHGMPSMGEAPPLVGGRRAPDDSACGAACCGQQWHTRGAGTCPGGRLSCADRDARPCGIWACHPPGSCPRRGGARRRSPARVVDAGRGRGVRGGVRGAPRAGWRRCGGVRCGPPRWGRYRHTKDNPCRALEPKHAQLGASQGCCGKLLSRSAGECYSGDLGHRDYIAHARTGRVTCRRPWR